MERTIQRRSSAERPAGANAVAMIPPAYGIDFVDRAAPHQSGLPGRLTAGIRSLTGLDLSNVRVHFDSGKPAEVHALAYAQGSDIHLAPGQERHLPHEAWHVVQQRQGRVGATASMGGVGVNDDQALEKEADAMGARAAAGPAQGRHDVAFVDGGKPSSAPAQTARHTVAGPVVQRQPASVRADEWTGMPIAGGSVETRANAEVFDEGGHKLSNNMAALTYRSENVADAHWLQFAWVELEGKAQHEKIWSVYDGELHTGTGTKTLTTDPRKPVWYVDTMEGHQSPFYDEASDAKIRNEEELTLLDRPGFYKTPGSDSREPVGYTWRLTTHLIAYLVRNGAIEVCIPWTSVHHARRTKDDVMLFAPQHTVSKPFVSQALPAALHEVLHSQYKDIAAKIAHE
jgi:hypothetical protein